MRKTLILVAVISTSLTLQANDAPLRRELKHANPCAYDALFTGGTVSEPCGATRGTVLYSAGHFPKLKARVQGSVWRGKTFNGDGTMINRWPGFEAVCASVYFDNSWFDGKPCLVMQYAANAKFFGGMRDELREIAPGKWLGRGYDSATGKEKGYFLLEAPR